MNYTHAIRARLTSHLLILTDVVINVVASSLWRPSSHASRTARRYRARRGWILYLKTISRNTRDFIADEGSRARIRASRISERNNYSRRGGKIIPANRSHRKREVKKEKKRRAIASSDSFAPFARYWLILSLPTFFTQKSHADAANRDRSARKTVGSPSFDRARSTDSFDDLWAAFANFATNRIGFFCNRNIIIINSKKIEII
jgi:hypothetical protein